MAFVLLEGCGVVHEIYMGERFIARSLSGGPDLNNHPEYFQGGFRFAHNGSCSKTDQPSEIDVSWNSAEYTEWG